MPKKTGGAHLTEKNTDRSTAVLWLAPDDITARDLFYGEGGERDAPKFTTFTFVKEDMSGTNPKYVVTDQAGVRWKIKLGAEAKPEVTASRFVWAVGYHVNEDYYLPSIQVSGLPVLLHRGRAFISKGGVIRGARMQRMEKGEESTVGYWEWKNDPFKGTREWNGLRVLMALINNWDLKDVNNKVITGKGHEGEKSGIETYFVSDLGASFGPTKIVPGLNRSRGNLSAYRSSRFITKTGTQSVNFATPGSPSLLELFNPRAYIMRLHLRWIGRTIPRGDVLWMATILSKLSHQQICDAFRAGGYSASEVEGFARVVENRIAALRDL